ncbi:NAD(P)-dependent oxidoreductase [Candidatus Pelagibacter sp.]|nr:NAD(P)-dependent oxidoreductase [Candidatus Pelagibacter sp.]
MKKKILITGGTGFIGYHLAKKCVRMGWEVTSFSKKKPKPIRTLKEVNYLFGDLTKKKDLKVLKKKFDYIVNAAGVVDHSSNPKVYKAHYLGCKNLANFFLKKKIKLFLQIGSCVEYGPQKSPQKEDYKPKISDLKSMYSKGKLAASKYLMELYDKYRFPVVIFRLYLNYGPNQDFNRFLPVIIDGCIRGKKFPCSSGIQYRSFTFVDDLVRAMVIALKKPQLSGNIFNIGNNKPVKIKKIIQYIRKYVKKGTPLYGKIKFRKDEIKSLYPNISKAKSLLNWQPKINFGKGLNKTINYYKSNIKLL